VAPPAWLVALQGATLSFGGPPLFNALTIGLARGDRLCLVGRNGSGKSTLLKALGGEQPLDTGARVVQPGVEIAYLPQDPRFAREATAAEHIAQGLGGDAAQNRYRIDAILDRLRLDGGARLAALSGGEQRRVALAKALVRDPDVLLLDEPTNHLDLPAIEWLEEELERFRGALLMVSHDRAFLRRLARATLWLDRGELRRMDRPFEQFEDWAAELVEREARDRHKLDRQIKREERWLQRGVTARRTRNQGRLRRLVQLRQSRREWLRAPGSADLALADATGGGDLVIEAKGIAKSYGERILVRDFSTRIRRRDRLGIIGRNGAGKTTLVRLLTGGLEPNSGSVKLGNNLQSLYFDQQRESLDPEATPWRTLAPDGGDSVMVRGRQRHVVSYLKDFLFDEAQARQPVRTLSGGEKNRLLLARLFAQPANLIVLDEPTNDLDMETLDLLEEVLGDYEGTLLVVSHDRDFLDRLVTGIIAVEGDGRIEEYPGGYSDYLTQRKDAGAVPARKAKSAAKETASSPPRRKAKAAKLSYKEERELGLLPGEIDRLSAEVTRLEQDLADPELYRERPQGIAELADRLEKLRRELNGAESRWLALEEKQERLRGGKDA
jgi:ATP-binding cassette subfamily F protein uup